MSSDSNSERRSQLLGSFASLLSLLGIMLFFAGWIYRWAYFAYFSLDINEQTFSAQSFVILPFHIFLGSFWNLFRTIVSLVALVVLISLTFALFEYLRMVSASLLFGNHWIQLLC
jgi:hypothetical protein